MRRLLTFGETEVRAHWTVLPAVLFLIVTEGPKRVGLGFLALLLHEAGHLFAARGLGYRVRALELWPFGAAMTTDAGARGSLPVALAGPLCGLMAAGMSLLLLRLVPGARPVLEPFCLLNLTLSAVNLLPAEPLDGGRALASLLAKPLGFVRARRVTAWGSLLFGGALLSLGIYGAILGLGSETALLFAAFLILSGFFAIRGEDRALDGLLDRQSSLRAGRPVEVRGTALNGDRTAAEALLSLRRGRYTLLFVTDGRGRILGVLDEGALLAALTRRGGNVPLRELVFSFDR